MSYQARIAMPPLIVTGRTGACGNTNRTGTLEPELRHDRLEVVAVGSQAVQPEHREPRRVARCDLDRIQHALPSCELAHMAYYMRNFIHAPFPCRVQSSNKTSGVELLPAFSQSTW